jgi:hypothetical protein
VTLRGRQTLRRRRFHPFFNLGRAALSCLGSVRFCSSAAGLRVWPGVPRAARRAEGRGEAAAEPPGPARQGRLEDVEKVLTGGVGGVGGEDRLRDSSAP